MTDANTAWFVFKIEDTEGEGVDAPRLSRFLSDLSSAFYAIARAKVGSVPSRPGRRTADEESLAGVRIVRIVPGSATIELAPPATSEQPRLPLADEPTPDDVAYDFYQEARRIEAGEPPQPGRLEIRRQVRAVVADAAEIGKSALITYRPRTPRTEWSAPESLSARVHIRDLTTEAAVPRLTRRRRVSGHAYMVDVEPGRERLRLKLPDGRDLTLDVHESIADSIPEAIDRVVELVIDESLEGEVVAQRVAHDLRLLPTAGIGSDRPPKPVDQLAQEQALPVERPDYTEIASGIWTNKQEVEEFEQHIRMIRQAATS